MNPHLSLTQVNKRLRVPCLIRLGLINNQLKSLKQRFMGLIEDIDSLERHADLNTCQMHEKIDECEKLLGLKVFELDDKLDLFLFHFGECKLSLEIKNDLDDFCFQHADIIKKFNNWIEGASDV